MDTVRLTATMGRNKSAESRSIRNCGIEEIFLTNKHNNILQGTPSGCVQWYNLLLTSVKDIARIGSASPQFVRNFKLCQQKIVCGLTVSPVLQMDAS